MNCKKSIMIAECLEPASYYDDWANYRDGFRNLSDKSLIKKYPNTTKLVNWEEPSEIAKNNKKLKRLIRRRKIRRNKLKWEY